MKMNHEKLKRITSFLTAFGMSCSMIASNGQAVFAYDSKAKATIINEDEHGSLTFAENTFEDVFIDVPVEPQPQYAFSIDENGNVVSEEVNEALEDVPDEQTTTEEPLDSEDDSGGETTSIESVTTTLTTESITKESTGEQSTTGEVTEETTTTETTEKVTEETTEAPIQYTQIVDPNSKIIHKGETVNINAIPEEGYSVESIYVLTDSGKAVNYSFNDNVISFTMPKNDVTIRATFTDAISNFTPDDSIMNNFTYIKSNLNSDYVTCNKWELVNLITVKQTVVNKSQYDALGKDVTIDNFNSPDNDFALLNSIINFQTFSAFVFDVDDNSDYYVAFVNSMQNDDCNVYDYCVAENNDYGNVLNGNYYDNNTGILYLKKDNISYISTIDDTITGLSNAQVQLLNAYDNSENTIHKINVNVDKSLNTESGIVEVGQYDSIVSIKLNNTDKNVKISINDGINIVENLNLSEDSSNNLYQYTADSNILKIKPSNIISINSIEIENTNKTTKNNNIEEYIKANAKISFASDLTEILDPDITLTLEHGSLKENAIGASYTTTVQSVYSQSGTTFINYDPASTTDTIKDGITITDDYVVNKGDRYYTKYVPDSFYGYGIDYTNTNSGFADEILEAIKGSNDQTIHIVDKLPTNSLFTHCIDLSTLANQQSIQFTDKSGNISNVSFSFNNKTKALLQCCHVSDSYAAKSENNANYDSRRKAVGDIDKSTGKLVDVNDSSIWGNNDIFIKILDITENTNATGSETSGVITWAIIDKVQYGQAGAAIFKSNFSDKNYSAIRFKKEFKNDTLTNSVAKSLYQKTGTEYKLYSGANNTGELIATFTTDANGQFSNVSTNTDLKYNIDNEGYIIFGYDKDTDTKQLEPGDYYLEETISSSGYNKAPGTAFKVEAGELYTIANDATINYPILTKMNINKFSSLLGYTSNTEQNDLPKSAIYNAEFDLYYSSESIVVKDIKTSDNSNDPNKYKQVSNITFENPDNVYKIAKFTINNSISNITIGKDIEGTNGYKLIAIDAADANITFPMAISSKNGQNEKDILTNCPKGYYVLVETKSADNHNLEIENDKPVYYYIDSTNVTPDTTSNNDVIDINTTNDCIKQKMYYNNDKYEVKTDLENLDKITNNQLKFEGIKKLSETSADMYGGASSEEFYKTFSHLYSVENARYSVTFNGLTIYGKTDSDGKIWWSMSDLPDGTLIYGIDQNTSIGTLYGAIGGFSAGDKITVTEQIPSKNTYINTKQKTYTFKNYNLSFNTGELAKIPDVEENESISPFTNGITIAKLGAAKGKIELGVDNQLHNNTIITFNNGTTKTINIEDTEIYTVTADDVKNGAYLLAEDLLKVNNIDTVNYLVGTKFDVWYNSTLDNSYDKYTNPDNWPKYAAVDENTNERYVKAKENHMVLIGTIEYVQENNKVIVKTTPIEFNVYNTDGTLVQIDGKTATYTAKVDEDTYFRNLPIGAYMITEVKAPANVKIGKNVTKYIYTTHQESINVFSESTTINNTSTPSDGIEISLEKVFEKEIKNIDLSGAKYSIYWTPYENNENQKEYLVGEFTVVKDANGKNRGVVSNSVFKKDGWTYAEGESGDKYNGLTSELIEAYITGRETNPFCKAFWPRNDIKNHKEEISKAMITNKDLTIFYGPIGRYRVIESKKELPSTEFGASSNNFTQDKTPYIKDLNGLDDNTKFHIVSKEDIKNDVFKFKLHKTTNEIPEHPGDTFNKFKPLIGGYFRIYFYETGDVNYTDPDILNNADELNNLLNDNKNTPSQVVSAQLEQDGIIDFSNSYSLIDITDNLGIPNGKHYEKSNINNGKCLEFPEGIAIVEEFKAPSGYKISNTDEFTIKQPNSNKVYHLGQKAIFAITYELDDEYNLNQIIKVRAQDPETKEYTWIPYQCNDKIDDALIDMSNEADVPSTYRNNTEDNDYFRFYKESADGKRLPGVQFEINLYDNNNNIYHTWRVTSDENGLVTSFNPAFATWNYRPLMINNKYRIKEISNNYYYPLDTGIFKYSHDTDIVSLFKSNSNKEDNNRTVTNFPMPTLTTKAWDTNSMSQAAVIKDGKISVTDTVNISNLATGNTYVIEGIAMDITDVINNPNDPNAHPIPLKDSNKNYIVASTKFKANGTGKLMNTSVDVEFEFAGNTEIFNGKTITFYEYLALAEVSDKSTYDYGFNATDNNFKYVDGKIKATEIIPEGENSVKCTSNLIDETGNITLTGKGFIQTINHDNYICHADPDDDKQYIHFPTIESLESDKYTANHTSGKHLSITGNTTSDNVVFVNDQVILNNLPVGWYRLICTVYNADTGEKLINRPVVFYCTDAEKYILNVNNLALPGENLDSFYITDILYQNGNIIAQHTDKVDTQTGYVADISTVAQNKIDNNKLVLEGSMATIKDTINYKNFNTGDSYRAYGYLVDKETEQVVAKADQDFIAKASNGTVDVNFVFDTTGLGGKTLVVYEYVYNGTEDVTFDVDGNAYSVNIGDKFDDMVIRKSSSEARLIARHYDNGDANQTIYIPHVSTSVSETTKTVLPIEDVTVEDIVKYENVLANEDYTLYGFIIDPQGTEDESDDTIVAMNHTTFNAAATAGDASMKFTFDAGKYYNKSLVVYEYLYFGKDTVVTFTGKVGDKFNKNEVPSSGTGADGEVKALVGKHDQSMDKDQTFTVTGIHIEFDKTDMNGEHLDGAVLALYKKNPETGKKEEIVKWNSTDTKPMVRNDLEIGEYVFAELEAPEGYALANPIEFSIIKVVDEQGNSELKAVYTNNPTEEISYRMSESKTYKEYQLRIADVPLATLPTAGGSGELPIAGLGIAMMLGGYYFIKRKKANG